MTFTKLFAAFFVSIAAFTLIFAQEKEDAANTKKQRLDALIEQIVADIPTLKLGENRAFADAKAGGLIWKIDQKRARTFFQNAVGELINAQMQAEANPKNNNFQYDLINGQSTRPQILQIIAARDAEFALDSLYRTRPAIVVKALALQTPKTPKLNNLSGNYNNYAVNELNMEQNFVRLAADQNPERAAELLKASLKKGLSGATLGLLQKLYEKDSQAASDFASEAVGKLIQSKFASNNQPDFQNINIAMSFLREFINQKNSPPNAQENKSLKFDDVQMKNLADKLLTSYLAQTGRSAYYMNSQMIPIAEKLAPALVEPLKKMPVGNSGFVNYYQNPEINKLLSSRETTADQIVAAAKKSPVESRVQLFNAAANKYAAQGDLNSARQILNDSLDDEALENALQSLNYYYVHQLMNEGKFTEAENLLESMPENNRISSLINFAAVLYQKNPIDNKSYALAMLGKARALISDKPENSQEMSSLMQIIQGYNRIEPTVAFSLYEPLVPQMNELSDAAAITNAFQGGGNVRQGEYLLVQGNSFGFSGADFSILRVFAEKDFDRTLNIINLFNRGEVRLSLKLQTAEGLAY